MRASTIAALLALLSAIAVDASAASKDDRKRAIELFRESETRYREGLFEEAAGLLREAYGLDPAPTLLYNLARALESAGDVDGAKEAYERYLTADPKARDRAAIERRIENLGRQIKEREDLEKRLAAEKDKKAAPPPAPEPPPPTVVVAEPLPPSEASPVPWIVAGVGGAVVVSGAVLGVIAKGRHDDAVAAPGQRDASTLADEASGLATAANFSFIAGGAIVAGGLLWGILTLGDESEDTVTVVPTVGPTYAGVLITVGSL